MLIKVKVFPEEKEEQIVKKSEDSFDVKVKEKPKMGKANEAVTSLLAYYFEIPRGKVRLIKGARERNKIFEIKE
jgi:uncharacterized protein